MCELEIWACTMWDISHFDCHLNCLLLRVKFSFLVCGVNELVTIVEWSLHTPRFEPSLEVVHLLLMLCEICGKDWPNNASAELKQCRLAHVMQEIIIVFEHEVERRSSMIILLDRLIVKSDCTLAHRILMEFVIDAVMSEIMAHTRD